MNHRNKKETNPHGTPQAEERRHLRLLHKTASLFRELKTLDDTIGALPELIADHYAVPIVAIELYEADQQEMVFAGSVGIPKTEDGPLSVPVDQTISGTVATSGRAVVELNVSERTDYRAEALKKLGVVTFACVPLIGQEGVIGTLAVADCKERPHIVGGADLLQALANSLTQEIERRRQEQQLWESEEKYRHLYETMTQGVVIQDAEGKIIEANLAASHILGLTREQLLGRTAYDPRWKLIHEDGSTYAPSEMPSNIALRTGKSVGNVTCGIYVPEKGEYRWVIIGSSPQYRGNDTKPSLTMTVFTDITKRKRAEDELLKARKLESIGFLAGGIAHDFNNILTMVFGNIQLAKMKVTPDHQAYTYLQTANQALERATSLTKQLLTFAKGGDPALEAMSLNQIIQKVVEFSLSGSNVKTTFSLPSDLWQVKADKSQISQVISNLAINADYAMQEGGALAIAAKNVKDMNNNLAPYLSGDFVELRFQDEGDGISPENLSKIFDPYFTTKEVGSGLGLAVVHSIITKHNGHISVDSELGVGTTFTLYLPAETSSHSTIGGAPSSIAEKSQTPLGNILVMDDEEMIRDLSTDMLESFGYTVDTAVDGQEALDKYASADESGNPFDVVIMDLTIPGGMGGAEAVRNLLATNPEAKVIVSSGYSTDPIVANYKEHGFKGYLSKPYQMEELEKELSHVMEEC